MLVSDRLCLHLCYLKMIEYILDCLELLMCHSILSFFFRIILGIFDIFFYRTITTLSFFLCELNLKLISLAHAAGTLPFCRLSLLTGSKVLCLFAGSWGERNQHIFQFCCALLIILSQLSDVKGYAGLSQAVINHFFKLLIAIENLSRNLTATHGSIRLLRKTFSLLGIYYSYGLIRLIQESNKNFFSFWVCMGDNKPLFSHFFICSKYYYI